MSEQDHQRWRFLRQLAKQCQKDGKPMSIDPDLFLKFDDLLKGLCADLIYERGEHWCPS